MLEGDSVWKWFSNGLAIDNRTVDYKVNLSGNDPWFSRWWKYTLLEGNASDCRRLERKSQITPPGNVFLCPYRANILMFIFMESFKDFVIFFIDL